MFPPGAARIDGRSVGITDGLVVPRTAAVIDGLDHVEGLFLADDDVVATGRDRVAGFHRHIAVAIVADHFQAAGCPHAVQITVVQALFGEDVGDLTIQIGLADDLAGEEARALQAVQPGADGTETWVRGRLHRLVRTQKV